MEAVIDDFMSGYYGRSGQYIRQYFDYLHNLITPDTHMGIFAETDHPFFSRDLIVEAEKIFNKAETVSDNADIVRRVEIARLPLLYLKCRFEPMNAKYSGAYKRFCDIVKRENIIFYSEIGEPERRAFHARMNALE